MRLLVSYDKYMFEAPIIWLNDDYVPVVGTQKLFCPSERQKQQSGPYMWLKIAMLDTVQVNASEGTIQWFPSAFRTALCPLHPFNESGLLIEPDNGSVMQETQTEHRDNQANVTASHTKTWTQMHVDSKSAMENDDFDELIGRAAEIVCRFKDGLLTGKNLCDAIFGWLYAFLLPVIQVQASDQPVLKKTIDSMRESLSQLTSCSSKAAKQLHDANGSCKNKIHTMKNMFMWSHVVCQHSDTFEYFLFVECDSENSNFSFGIPLACRSYKEITMVVSQTPKFVLQRELTCERLTAALQGMFPPISNFNPLASLLAMTGCDCWWQEENDKLVLFVQEQIDIASNVTDNNTGTRPLYDARIMFNSKVSLVCSDIMFQDAGEQVVKFYDMLLVQVLEKLKNVRLNCHHNPFDGVQSLLLKYKNSSQLYNTTVVNSQQFSERLLNAIGNLEAISREISLFEKARLLLLAMREIRGALSMYMTEFGADELIDCLVDMLPLVDCLTFTHIKILSDFITLTTAENSGKLANAITSIMAAYYYLLDQYDLKLAKKHNEVMPKVVSSDDDESFSNTNTITSSGNSEANIVDYVVLGSLPMENSSAVKKPSTAPLLKTDLEHLTSQSSEYSTASIAITLISDSLEANVVAVLESLPMKQSSAIEQSPTAALLEIDLGQLAKESNECLASNIITMISDPVSSRASSTLTLESLSIEQSSTIDQSPTALLEINAVQQTRESHDTVASRSGSSSLEQSADSCFEEDISIIRASEEDEKLRNLQLQSVAALRAFKMVYENWNNTRLECIESLTLLAASVRKTVSDTNIASITGSSVGVVGGVLAIVGFALIPVTVGASAVLIITGAVVGGASGATGFGSFIARQVLNSKQKKILKSCCDCDRQNSEQLLSALQVVIKLDQQIMARLSSSVLEQRYLTSRNSGTADTFDTILIASSATKIVKTALSPFKALSFIKVAGNVVAESTEAVATTAGAAFSAVRVAGVAFSGAFVAVDIFSMVLTAIEIHKGNRSELYKTIIALIDRLDMERQYYATLCKQHVIDRVN